MRYIEFIYFCFSRCLVFLLRAHHVLMYVLINFTFARNQWSVKTKFISHFTIHWRFTYRVFFSSPSFFFHFRLKLPRQISMDTWIHCNNNKNHMMKKLIRFLFGIAKGTRQPAYRIMTLDTSHWKAIGYNRPNELNCCYIWPKWVSSWHKHNRSHAHANHKCKRKCNMDLNNGDNSWISSNYIRSICKGIACRRPLSTSRCHFVCMCI